MALDGMGVARDRRCRQCPFNWQQSPNVTPAHPVLGTSRPVARYCAAAGNDPSTWKVINEAFVEGPATNCAQSFWATLTPVDLTAQAAVIAARQNQMTIQQWTATLNAKLPSTATIQDVQTAVANLVTLGVLTTAQGAEVVANVAAARGITVPTT